MRRKAQKDRLRQAIEEAGGPYQPKGAMGELDAYDLRVTGVRIQCEIDVLNKETGKLENRVLTDAHVIYEHAFFPGLVDYLRVKGLGRGLPNPTPEEKKDDPAKAVRKQ